MSKKYKDYFELSQAANKDFIEKVNIDEESLTERKSLISLYQKDEKIQKKYMDMKIKNNEEFLNIPIIKYYWDYLNNDYKELFYEYLKLPQKIEGFKFSIVYGYFTYKRIKELFMVLDGYVVSQYLNFDMLAYLNGKEYLQESYHRILGGNILPVMLNRNDELSKALLDKIKSIFYDNENVTVISYHLISEILRSDNPEAIEIVMNVLKAAKLSEGLRSSIMHASRNCSLDNYKTFMKYIKDENLIRFSSVREYLLNNLGIYVSKADKWMNTICGYLVDCIVDNSYEEFMASDNKMKFYVGVYVLALNDHDKVIRYFKDNYKTMVSYKRQLFLEYLANTNIPMESEIITYTLNNEDHNALASLYNQIFELTFENDDDKKAYIKAFIDNLPKIDKIKKYSTFDEYEQRINLIGMNYDDVLEFVDDTNYYYDEAFEYFDKYTNKSRYHKDGYFKEIKNPVVRKTLINSIASNKEAIRNYALSNIKSLNIEFTEDEYMLIGGFLKTKRSDTRKSISKLFSRADKDIILNVSENLLNDKNKMRQNGAVSILADNMLLVKDDDKFEDLKVKIESMEFSEDVISNVNKILNKNAEEKNTELFFEVDEEIIVPEIHYDIDKVNEYIDLDMGKVKDFINQVNDIFESHKGEEVKRKDYDDTYFDCKIGYDVTFANRQNLSYEESSYKDYFFYEEYLEKINIADKELCLYPKIIELTRDHITNRVYNTKGSIGYYSENGYLPNFDFIHEFIDEHGVDRTRQMLTGASHIIDMISKYRKEQGIDIYDSVKDVYNNLVPYYIEKDMAVVKADKPPKELLYNNRTLMIFNTLGFLIDFVFSEKNIKENKEIVKMDFENIIELYTDKLLPLNADMYFDLIENGIITKNRLYKIIFENKECESDRIYAANGVNIMARLSRLISYEAVPGRRSSNVKKVTELQKEVYFTAIDLMLKDELDRTEQDGKYTNIISRCSYFVGAENFIQYLSKMGSMPFVRGYSYGNYSKKDSFSSIIKNTYPEKDLDQDTFNKLVKKYKVTDKKLLEGCMYNLEFITYAENYLKINGLTKAAYYFRAHMNDNYSLEEEKIIRRYSDIDLKDFQDGQMDLDWYRESYQELGKANFEKLYDAAKYITNGGNHKRAQYFADAVQGKLKIKEVEERINDKRNQEMVLVYGLLPLRGNKDNAALKRYKRLQLFLKESKTYGAQRRQSEALKVNISMNNLARNYGTNINQFTWIMEAKLIEKVNVFFEPKKIDDMEVYISLDNPMNPEIMVSKSDKKLKNIPAKYKKDKYIVELKETKKDLKDQYKRARNTLENSMINEDEFTLSELQGINSHMLISKILKDILFVANGEVGFLHIDESNVIDGLVNYNGDAMKLEEDAKLIIAHPVHLIENNWVEWQNYIMDNEIKQPFKQVFRELYTMTEEEKLNDGYTDRFAGYQINSRQMQGIMKSRGWVINYYDGFEKVNHKSDLRVDLYCYADWFTPNDVEEPTIERVKFINNKTNKSMDMNELSKVLYSEAMRDIDLVVSVAYVGGVDPLLNHTTLEMRKRILEHNLKLFKIDNYEMGDKHITIKGELNNYSIHLGSGIIHTENKGMLPIFPVHSQQRGHIFLPFVDEDPKTSELVTKVLVLAKDNEIKDPSILMHIR